MTEKSSRSPTGARLMPGGGDEVGAALPGGWRVPKIVAATRWMLAMLASGPSISRLSVEEVSPHGTASSQHQLISLEYAEIRLRTSCLIVILLYTVKGSRDRAANSLSLSSSHPVFTGGKLLYSLLPSCNSNTRADQLPCPQQISPAHPTSSRHSQTFVC